MIGGIVLAAGASSRMGRPKAALPIGPHGQTVLARVVGTLTAAGLPRIVVVAGAHPAAVRGALATRDPRVLIVDHPGWVDGQLTSLLCGLDALRSPMLEAALVTLVDVPLVAPGTVRAVMHAWRATRAPLVRPARGDEHGHPVIFDAAAFPLLRAADPTVGAKPVVRGFGARIVNVPVDDPGAFVDMDTPEEWEALTKSRNMGD